MTDPVRLCAIRADALSVDEVLAALDDPGCGAQVLFLGRVRDHDHARDVAGLGYSGHPGAEEAMQAVCRAVAARHDVRALAAVHRVGDLGIGDIAVIVAAAAAHRAQAFAAARDLIDTLKATVPIWKHQRYADGTDTWVGLP